MDGRAALPVLELNHRQATARPFIQLSPHARRLRWLQVVLPGQQIDAKPLDAPSLDARHPSTMQVPSPAACTWPSILPPPCGPCHPCRTRSCHRGTRTPQPQLPRSWPRWPSASASIRAGAPVPAISFLSINSAQSLTSRGRPYMTSRSSSSPSR